MIGFFLFFHLLQPLQLLLGILYLVSQSSFALFVVLCLRCSRFAPFFLLDVYEFLDCQPHFLLRQSSIEYAQAILVEWLEIEIHFAHGLPHQRIRIEEIDFGPTTLKCEIVILF